MNTLNRSLVKTFLKVVLQVTTPKNVEWDIDTHIGLRAKGYIDNNGNITEKGYAQADKILLDAASSVGTREKIAEIAKSVLFYSDGEKLKRPYGLTDEQWYLVLDFMLNNDLIIATNSYGVWEISSKGKKAWVTLRKGLVPLSPESISSQWQELEY